MVTALLAVPLALVPGESLSEIAAGKILINMEGSVIFTLRA
jgi:hypothetical protein